MALGVGGPGTRAADALYAVQERWVRANGPAQVGPLGPTAASDHVVDHRERVLPVVEVTVTHIGFSHAGHAVPVRRARAT